MTPFKHIPLLLCFILITVAPAYSNVPITTDSRIKNYIYNENDVFKINVQYGYQTNIELTRGETVETIAIGNGASWQIRPQGRRIFIKALEGDAHTNMTVITNRRTYQMELQSSYPGELPAKDLAYVIRFFYPDEQPIPTVPLVNPSLFEPIAPTPPPLMRKPFNFNYSLTGSQRIAPIKIFDDGKETYLQFADQHAPIPYIYAIYNDGRRELIQPNRKKEFVVIPKIIGKLALQLGQEIAFVYNDNVFPQGQ